MRDQHAGEAVVKQLPFIVVSIAFAVTVGILVYFLQDVSSDLSKSQRSLAFERDLKNVTFDDVAADPSSETNSDLYVVTPGVTMRLDCVRIGDEATDSPASGGGLGFCKWRKATDADIQEITKANQTGGPSA